MDVVLLGKVGGVQGGIQPRQEGWILGIPQIVPVNIVVQEEGVILELLESFLALSQPIFLDTHQLRYQVPGLSRDWDLVFIVLGKDRGGQVAIEIGDSMKDFLDSRGRKGRVSNQHLKQDAADGPVVNHVITPTAQEQLGGHVIRGSNNGITLFIF